MTEDNDLEPDYLRTFAQDATDDDLDELGRHLAANDEDVDGPSILDDFFNEFEDDVSEFEAELDATPGSLRKATGECLWIGFDAEWVYDEARRENRILSIQLYVPSQKVFSADKKKAAKAAQLSRVIYARGPKREDRPELRGAIRQIVETALDERLIESPPRLIYVVGFGLRFDLGALADFGELKRQVDSVSGKVATVKGTAELEFDRSMVTGDSMEPVMIGLHFIDAAAHVPPGKALRDVGLLIDKPKLDIPAPYSIERMDEYLREDRAGFEAYAMRDAEIAVLYAMRLQDFASNTLQIETLPATASGLALRWYLKTLKEAGIDRLSAFGLQRTTREAFHTPTKRRRTYTDEEPTQMRKLQEALTSACYAGGRNEAYWLGPTPVGEWFDYDLAGAYSTGLLDLPLIDFDRPMSSTNVADYLGHVAGYALIDFVHPPGVRFPVFAISRGGKGLIFPLEGSCYATAPEIQAAHDLGCQINIRWGIVYPWRRLADDPKRDGALSIRLFGDFIKSARHLRNELKRKLKIENAKRKAEGKDEIESLEEQAAKLYANGLYGKVCQAIAPRNVFDTRQVKSTRLPPSPITNSALGAHVTGFIRAILAEILNKIPRHRTVVSCTTDGFLTDTTESEIKDCLTGPLCRRFQALCDDIDQYTRDLSVAAGDAELAASLPKTEMLEVKHRVAQIVCMKTRGQLTGALAEGGKVVLAKAGVQPVVEASSSLSAEAFKRLQNDKMLNLYLDRRPGKKILSRQFPSIRDQWEKGIDLHKFERRIVLSLEPDLKRRFVDPQMIEVQIKSKKHLAMASQPWRRIENFDVARARLDAWRQNNSLKTLRDWNSFAEALQLGETRSRARARGATSLNLRAGTDASDLLRRAFIRAYAQKALGLERTMTYRELADWLTSIGQATTEKEITSARSQKLVTNAVPPMETVQKLFRELKKQFPDADLMALIDNAADSQ